MPGFAALKASATSCSILTWVGASPVPRQQYQRISTSPGFAWDALFGSGVGGAEASDASGEASAEATAACEAGADGAVLAELGPQAPTSRASTEMRTTIRPMLRCMRAFLRLRLAGASDLTDMVLLLLHDSGDHGSILFARGISRAVRAGVGTDDDALDEIARAVAPHVGPAELDRPIVGGRCKALDEQRGRAPRLVEQGSFARPQEDRFERLARSHDPGVVAPLQQVVERLVLQVGCQQTREPLGRQVDLLEEDRLAAREPQALEVQRRRTRLQAERLRHSLAGRLRAGRR